jgi:hypothetical protein
MKKSLTILGAATASVFLLAGCGGKKNVQPEPAFVQHCEYTAGVRAPEWYCNPNIEGGIAAIGEAKPNAARDNNMQRTVAMGAARDELARQMEVKVKNMLESWSRTTGAGEAQTYEANIASVSRQVSSSTLQGSKQLNRWMTPDGTLVVLVGMSDTAQIKDNIKTSLKNEDALWQQFQSKQAQDALDAEIAKEFGN